MLRSLWKRLIRNEIKVYQLESIARREFPQENLSRVVGMRRSWKSKKQGVNIGALRRIPYKNYNYSQIYNRNCENVIGYTPVPVGLVGPLKINGTDYHVPLATTEGGLIGSLNRGAKAISLNNTEKGIKTMVVDRGITRAPVLELGSLEQVQEFVSWIENKDNFQKLQEVFGETSRFGELQSVTVHHAGTKVHLRLVAFSGDAMGMNIISKGSEAVVQYILKQFPVNSIEVLSLSGNCCTDKKPSAMNWIHGRGKMVIAETFLPENVLDDVLHTYPENLIRLNQEKNLIGSSLAGSIGGNNAHVANVVAGIFIATGQDVAQIGTSSVGLTQYESDWNWVCDRDEEEPRSEGEKGLKVSLTMPALEVGTVGGGTQLEAQKGALEILGIDNSLGPGENAKKLAEIVAGTALAGEISLMSALSSGDLVQAHLRLNRGKNGKH